VVVLEGMECIEERVEEGAEEEGRKEGEGDS